MCRIANHFLHFKLQHALLRRDEITVGGWQLPVVYRLAGSKVSGSSFAPCCCQFKIENINVAGWQPQRFPLAVWNPLQSHLQTSHFWTGRFQRQKWTSMSTTPDHRDPWTNLRCGQWLKKVLDQSNIFSGAPIDMILLLLIVLFH